MKVVVVNIGKLRSVIKAVRIIAFMLVFLLLGGFLVNLYLNSEKYVSAMFKENEKNLIIIDAGHGGEDPGAIGIDSIYEKDLNLSISKELGAALETNGFAVMYTRTEDKLLYKAEENIKGIRKISDLKNRCKIAAEYPNAIFISIHMNSYGDSKYSGTQVYYSTRNEYGRMLASAIQESVKASVQPNNNRVIKSGEGIYVLENTENVSVLVECGFITNSEECKKLSEKEYQKELSLAIVCGIIKYVEKVSSH